MNKQEFLDSLRENLNGLPKDEIEDRLSFYDESIEDRKLEGKSEEEAINDLGSIDEIVNEIAKETSLVKLVKEKVKPKRSLKVWEIVLICVSFPLWLPLLIVAIILAIIGYLLLWILVIVTYVVETAMVVGSVGGIVVFFAYLAGGDFTLLPLAISFMCAGGAVLFGFVCYFATKANLKLSKTIFTKIKAKIIKKGSKK